MTCATAADVSAPLTAADLAVLRQRLAQTPPAPADALRLLAAVERLVAENATLQGVAGSLARRVAVQAELLSRVAERPHCVAATPPGYEAANELLDAMG